jgi:hypothetical protein
LPITVELKKEEGKKFIKYRRSLAMEEKYSTQNSSATAELLVQKRQYYSFVNMYR